MNQAETVAMIKKKPAKKMTGLKANFTSRPPSYKTPSAAYSRRRKM